MLSRHEAVHRVKLTMTCISIAANAYDFLNPANSLSLLTSGIRLCAGGIFTFPLLSPALAEHLKLTQPQLTTIVLA